MQRIRSNYNNEISPDRFESEDGNSTDSSGASKVVSDSSESKASENHNPVLKKYQELLWKKIKNRQLRIAIKKNNEACKLNQSVRDLTIEELIKRNETLEMQIRDNGLNPYVTGWIHDRKEMSKTLQRVVSDNNDGNADDRLILNLLEQKRKLYTKLNPKQEKIMNLKAELMQSQLKLQSLTNERLEMINEIELIRKSESNDSRTDSIAVKSADLQSETKSDLDEASVYSNILYRLIAFSGVDWSRDEECKSLLLSCGKPLSQQMQEIELSDGE